MLTNVSEEGGVIRLSVAGSDQASNGLAFRHGRAPLGSHPDAVTESMAVEGAPMVWRQEYAADDQAVLPADADTVVDGPIRPSALTPEQNRRWMLVFGLGSIVAGSFFAGGALLRGRMALHSKDMVILNAAKGGVVLGLGMVGTGLYLTARSLWEYNSHFLHDIRFGNRERDDFADLV